MALPTVPIKPAAIRHHDNGKLPMSVLVPVRIGPSFFWHVHPADRAFAALVGRARQAGFDLRSTGGYRSFIQQLNLFRDRYRPVTLEEWLAESAEHRKYWADATSYGHTSPYWIKVTYANGSRPATAAVPGTSNHGDALSNDLAEELDGDVQPEAISRAAVSWLRANAWRFGIVNEVASEPWHWTFMLGDTITDATLAWEHESTGIPLPPPLTPPITPPIPPAPPAPPKARVRMFLIVGNKDNKADPRRWLYDGMHCRLLLDEADFNETKFFGWLALPNFTLDQEPFWKPMAWIAHLGG